MRLRNITQLRTLRGKTVLLRAALDVPLTGARIRAEDADRIERTLPTLHQLLKKGARVIIVTKRGRPRGVDERMRVQPIVEYLMKALSEKDTGSKPDADWFPCMTAATLRALAPCFPAYSVVPGRVMMLENIRFVDGEKKNSAAVARALASLADLFVNDAFADSVRAHASIVGVTAHMPAYAGFLIADEVSKLRRLLDAPRDSFVAVLGGAKLDTKLGLIHSMTRQANTVLLGGALAKELLSPRAHTVSRHAKKILTSKHILLPRDVVVQKRGKTAVVASEKIGRVDADNIIDIGPAAAKEYAERISHAKTIMWNGPVGIFEQREAANGTTMIVKAVAHNKKARVVVGGGETLSAYRTFVGRTSDDHVFLSTGGGAMIEFLQKETLPGIEPLLL